jgi:hypothetical protein
MTPMTTTSESNSRFLAKVLLTPAALAVFGLWANERVKRAELDQAAQIADLERSAANGLAEAQRESDERIAAGEREIALMGIYKDQIVSNDPGTRIAAIGVVGALNNELAERLIRLAAAQETAQKEGSQEVIAFANKTLGNIQAAQAFRNALRVEMSCVPKEGRYYDVKFKVQGTDERVKSVRFALLNWTKTSSDRAASFESGLTMRFCRAATLQVSVMTNDGAEGLQHSVCNDPAWLSCMEKAGKGS